MKGDLPRREPDILKKWIGLYEKIKKERKRADKFVLHDGPPYANGNIHIGHALNKILKDVINKYNLLCGRGVDYIPGWDCHGLPIERQVEKEMKKEGKSKEDLSKVDFRKLCRDYAKKYVEIQKKEFIRLGVLGDWENPYLTMDPEYESMEILELSRFFEKGLIYRSKKPVYWCIYDMTAEAEAEVEYAEREDPSIYVGFPLKDDPSTFLVIWTTTPWTLPANMGVMVGEKYEYLIIKDGNKKMVVAKELYESFQEKAGKNFEIEKHIKGKDLIGIEYIHPFVKKDRLRGYISEKSLEALWKVYPSEFVDLSAGTGLVHMAPGHGNEDYIVGLRYGLEPFAPVDDRGYFVEPAPEFIRGIRVFEANEKILERLQDGGYLLHRDSVIHSYPHCWRCKNPVIFRATDQWFISMEARINGKTLRDIALEEIERVKWIPESGKIRIRSMVEARPDWCISRQRLWGVPIAVFYCSNCSAVVSDKEVLERIAEEFRRSDKGSDVWFELTPGDLLPKGYRCKVCGGQEFKKEEDILDVWFDSGCSHAQVLRRRGIEEADLYLEGSDQHRGWFQASLLESVGSYTRAPYKSVLTHGFTVDEKGRKMSKSLGNVVSPQDVIQEFGADILRLWVVSEDYSEDVKLGKGILKNIAEDYRKIRNTIRFMLGNLYDFSPESAVDCSDMHHFDRWILSRFQRLVEKSHLYYKRYTFHRVYQIVRNFCTRDLSSIYLDVIKDRLYVLSPADPQRRSAQTALYTLLEGLIPLLAPFLSFTAEEAWEHLRKINPRLPESVFLYKMPVFSPDLVDDNLESDYEYLLSLRDDVLKALELARREGLIRHPYEAKVYITGDEVIERTGKYKDYLNYFLTVSQVEFSHGGSVEMEGEAVNGIIVGVSRAEGKKCPRCWIYFPEDKFSGDLCHRCCNVIESTRN